MKHGAGRKISYPLLAADYVDFCIAEKFRKDCITPLYRVDKEGCLCYNISEEVGAYIQVDIIYTKM